MIKQGVGGMMVAHLSIPALDDTPIKPGKTTTMPTTLSKKVVTDLLKNEMQYKGLIFTDALNMKGASGISPKYGIDVAAFLVGNDILLIPNNVSTAIKKMKRAFKAKKFSEERLALSVKKILKAKYLVGFEQNHS